MLALTKIGGQGESQPTLPYQFAEEPPTGENDSGLKQGDSASEIVPGGFS